MKKLILIASSLALVCIAAVVVMFSLYSNRSMDQNKDTYFYSGQSESWLATYSVTKAKSSYYNLLTIQYLFDPDEIGSETEKIGPIEYQLELSTMNIESSSPQELQGIGTLNTGNRINADFFHLASEETGKLTIDWQGKTETLDLEAKN